jgi:hypothetical protein
MRVIKLLSCLLVAAALWACGGGGGSPGSSGSTAKPLGTGAPAALTIPAGTALTFPVSGGVPPYSAASPNAGIVGARVDGLNLIVTGVNASSTPVGVVLRDNSGATTSVTVTVSSSVTGLDLKLSPATLTISEGYGQPVSFLVGGGAPPYRALVDNLARVAVDSVDARAIVLSGVGGEYCGDKATTVTLTVLDSQGMTATSTLVINDDESCP